MEQDALEQKRAALLAAGVLMMDPSAVYVEAGVTVGAGTLLLPGTILRGDTVIGRTLRDRPQRHAHRTAPWGMARRSTPPSCNESTIGRRRHMWAPLPTSAPTAMWEART